VNDIAVLAAARGVYYAATLLLFGSGVFGVLLKRRLPIIAPVRLPRGWLLLAALLAACAWFILAAAQMAGALSADAIGQAAAATLFGQIFLVRLVLLLGLVLVPERRALPATLLAGLALALPAATSHASSASPAGFAVIGAILDALHLLAAGFWIGGLAVLAALFRRKEPNILLALSLFSDWAMAAVLLLAMTGLIDGASIILGGSGEGSAPSSLYLAVLGAKLALVAGMLTLATANRFRLMPQGRTETIARNAAWELGLGFIVVLLAGALGQLPPTP
jgi:putative copper resistance protein D